MQMNTGLTPSVVAHAHCHFCVCHQDVCLVKCSLIHLLHSTLILDDHSMDKVSLCDIPSVVRSLIIHFARWDDICLVSYVLYMVWDDVNNNGLQADHLCHCSFLESSSASIMGRFDPHRVSQTVSVLCSGRLTLVTPLLVMFLPSTVSTSVLRPFGEPQTKLWQSYVTVNIEMNNTCDFRTTVQLSPVYPRKVSAFMPLRYTLMQMNMGLAPSLVAHVHLQFCVRRHDVCLVKLKQCVHYCVLSVKKSIDLHCFFITNKSIQCEEMIT
ncbi:unnamed protein product [Acanthosepion pharaonis]|uniref:Uncharacterized protein n=1 Tax=Acanthosepion pharaonis TaxID=158019 RepID=A0A812AX57_ACAPH|nr:unnamed protein product [Sepia pharaonis]